MFPSLRSPRNIMSNSVSSFASTLRIRIERKLNEGVCGKKALLQVTLDVMSISPFLYKEGKSMSSMRCHLGSFSKHPFKY